MNLAYFREKAVSFLRYTERYTKTDMLYLVQGGFWLSVGKVFSAAAAFLISVALANLLPQDTFGTYRFVLSLAGILSAFTLPGINTALIRAVARGMEGSVTPALHNRIKAGAIGSLIALGIAAYYFFKGNDLLALSSLIVAAFLPFFDTFTLLNAFLQGRKDFRRDIVYESSIRILAALGIVGTAFVTTNLFVLLAAYFASYTLLRAGYFFYVVRRATPKNGTDPEMVRYGMHLSFMGAGGLIAAHLDKILLFHYLGAVEVAIYAVASAIPENARGVIKSFSTLLTPKFAQDTDEDVTTRVHALWPKVFLISGVLIAGTLIYFPLAPYVYSLLFPTYPDAVLLSQVLMAGLLTGISAIPMMLLQSQKQTAPLYGLVAITTVVQIGLLLLLTPLFGLWGAVWARLGGYFFQTICTFGTMMFLYRK